MKKLILQFAVVATLLSFNVSAQISLSTLSDFQDGTIQSWTVGGAGTNPVNIADIGPSGTGDNALVMTSVGGVGPNANLVIENSASAWTGNWTTAGVAFISFWANNVGATPVMLRVGVDGPGGEFSSTNGVTVPAGSGWVQVNIPVQGGDFTADGGTNVASTLSAVTAARISHSTSPSWDGEAVSATVQIDNIQPGNVPLPIELSYFKATVQQNVVMLNWTTQSEMQSDYFAVMQSNDGTSWKELSRVKAAGNSKGQKNYSWRDMAPVTGDSYYKLKMVDQDGTIVYSKIEIVTVRGLEVNQGIVVYPNPSYNGVIYVTGTSGSKMQIFSSLGTDVTNQLAFNNYADGQYEINIQMLRPGMYYLKTDAEVRAFIKN